MQKLFAILLLANMLPALPAPAEMSGNTETVAVILNPEGSFKNVQGGIHDGITLFFRDKSDVSVELIATGDDLAGQREAAGLVAGRNIRYVIGHNFSSLAEAFLRSLPGDYEMTYISPLATNEELVEINRGVFLPWPSNSTQMKALASFVNSENLSSERVALVVNESEPYSTDMAALFESIVCKDRCDSVTRISYIKDSLDEDQIATSIFSFKADMVFAPCYAWDLARILAALYRSGDEVSEFPVFLSGDSVGTESIFFERLGQNTGVLAARIFFTGGWSREIKNVENNEFIGSFEETYGRPPTEGAAGGFDAARLLYNAMTSKEKTDLGSANQWLLNEDLEITVGRVSFDGNRTLQRPAVIWEITPDGYNFRGLF